MASTIQDVLRPFFVMCFIVGVGVYPTKQSKLEIRRIIYLSILYSLTIWFAYGYFFYHMIAMFSLRELFRSTITIAVLKINIVMTITSAITNLYYQKKLEICLIKLNAIDDTLEKLGTPKMYQRMYILSKRVVIGWIVYCLVANFYDTKWWLQRKKTSSWGYVLPYILNHYVHINTFIELLFIIFSWHLHLELCRIARELNLIFGAYMTVNMASYLLYITALCYYLFVIWKYQIKTPMYDKSNIIVWLLIFSIRFCTINLVCENVCIKANKTGIVIHQLTNFLRYADISKEIYQFVLQSVQHPLKFSGIGLFNFGNVFIQKFFTTVLTFVIITAQMKMHIRA